MVPQDFALLAVAVIKVAIRPRDVQHVRHGKRIVILVIDRRERHDRHEAEAVLSFTEGFVLVLHAPGIRCPRPLVAPRILAEIRLAHRRPHAVRERREAAVIVADKIRHLIRPHNVKIWELPSLDGVLAALCHLLGGEVVHDEEDLAIKPCPFRRLVHERRQRRAEAVHIGDEGIEHRVAVIVAHDGLLEDGIDEAVDDDTREVRIARLLSSDVEIDDVLAFVAEEIRAVEEASRACIGVVQEVVVPVCHGICQNRHTATSLSE